MPVVVLCCLLLLALSAAVVALSVMTMSLHHDHSCVLTQTLWWTLSRLIRVKVRPSRKTHKKSQVASSASLASVSFHANGQTGLLASVNSSRTVAQTSVPNTEGEKRTSGSDAQLKFTPQRASHKECEGRDEAEKSVQLGQAEDADELVNDSVKQNILKKFDKVCSVVVCFLFVSILIIFVLVITALTYD